VSARPGVMAELRGRRGRGRPRSRPDSPPPRDLAPAVEHRDPVRDGHDQIHVVLDEEDGHPEVLPDAPDHAHQLASLGRVEPPAGSSSSSNRGPPARARASSSRFCRPRGKAPASSSATSASPSRASRSSARCRAWISSLDPRQPQCPAHRPAAKRAVRPTSTFSTVDRARNTSLFWKVRRTPGVRSDGAPAPRGPAPRRPPGPGTAGKARSPR
jgi:hypothetical protein